MKKPGRNPEKNTAAAAWYSKALSMPLPHLGTAYTILMLCSINDRQAIVHFLSIAGKMPGIRFRLVLNEHTDESSILTNIGMLPSNCIVFGAQEDHLPFYQEAHLVLNLSTPGEDSTITDRSILESMACARPVIVPEMEGKFQMVTDGHEGYHINPQDENRMVTAIRELCSDTKTYFRFSIAAREKARMSGYFSNL